jgi:hypothetical protein
VLIQDANNIHVAAFNNGVRGLAPCGRDNGEGKGEKNPDTDGLAYDRRFLDVWKDRVTHASARTSANAPVTIG